MLPHNRMSILSESFLPAVGYKILNSTFSPQEIFHFGPVNTMKQFI